MQKYNITNNMIAFTLTQTTVKAYISYLEKKKTINLMVIDGLLQISMTI
jgi:hypothetical protein